MNYETNTGYQTTMSHLTTDINHDIRMLSRRIAKLEELMLVYSFGLGGHEYVAAGASSTSGQEYILLEALQDTTVTYTEANTGTITGKALLAGDKIYGIFTSVSVDGGGTEIRLYKRRIESVV